jgi:hypothetical protein
MIKVICENCGREMSLNQYDPDQDEAYVGYDCSKCEASFYGTYKSSKSLPHRRASSDPPHPKIYYRLDEIEDNSFIGSKQEQPYSFIAPG